MNVRNIFLKRPLLLLFALWIALPSTAQVNVTIGTGTSSGTSMPVGTNYSYSASESIYLGTEINTTGNITKIAYEKGSGNSTVPVSVSIYMKTTAAAVTATPVGAAGLTAYTLVYSGNLPNTSATGWMEVPLNTPFPFTSTATNLAVLVVANTYIPLDRPQYRYTTTSPNRRGSYYQSGISGGAGTAWSATSTMTTALERANARLEISPVSACGFPTAAGTPTLTSVGATLQWTAPGVAPSTGYEWKVVAYGGAATATALASGTTTSVSAIAAGLSDNTPYTYYVRSNCGGTYSSWAGGTFTTLCGNAPLPYNEGFESITANNALPTCMAATNLASKVYTYTATQALYNRMPRTGTRFASFYYSANDWIFTKPLYLTAGNTYQFSTWYITDGSTGWTTLQAKFGTTQTAAGMTGTITGASVSSVTNATYTRLTGTFTVSTTGVYYVGINCVSTVTPNYLSIDDISVAELPACNTVLGTFPSSVTTVSSKASVCTSEDVAFSLGAVMPSATGITYQWKSSANNTTYTNVGAATASATATLNVSSTASWFKCDVLCNGSTVLTSTAVQVPVQLQVNATPGSRCGAGSVTLSATNPSGNPLKWYTASSGGSSVYTGGTYNTPSISTTTNYYVAADAGGVTTRNGALSPSISPTNVGSTNNGNGQIFNVTQLITLKSVTVFPVDAGSTTISLRNSSDQLIQQINVTITGAQATSTSSPVVIGAGVPVTLNWSIPVGTGYKLIWDNPSGAGSNRVLRNLAGATSYYNVSSNGLTFTGNNGSGTSYWYNLYDWVVTTGCGEGDRVEVAATINSAPTATATNTGPYLSGSTIGLQALPAGLTYEWSGPASYTSAAQTPAISNSTTAMAGAYTVKVTDGNNCTATATTSVNVSNQAEWTGSVNSNWTETGNWTPGVVPNDCSANVLIPTYATGTHYSPAINAQNISVRNIEIKEGATLTLNYNLNVCGQWTGGTNSNAVISGTGIVNFVGSGSQLINGRNLFDLLQVNNSTGVALSNGAQVAIRSGLHLQHGNLDVTAGTLRLLSTAANNHSYIDDFTSGYNGNLVGNISMERFVPSAGYNQHFVSSPLNGVSFTQLNASGPNGAYIIPSDNCDPNNSATNSPYGTVFAYNDGYRPSGACMLGNWQIKSAGNMDTARGYSAYINGNTTLSLNGSANTGNISARNLNNSGYPLVRTSKGTPVESGWNLVGNPYPSAIDLRTSRMSAGFGNQVQVWMTEGPFSGSWQILTITGTNPVIIPPYQAFMVRAISDSTGTRTYPFYQSERIRNNTATFYRNNSENTLQLELDANGVKDVTTVSFNALATEKFDEAYDANKQDGKAGRPTIYTTLDENVWYGINNLPSLTEVATVNVGLLPEKDATMTITAQGLESFDPTSYILLEDAKTGNWHNLRNGAYTFTANKNDARQRFVLHFTPAVQMLSADATCEAAGVITMQQPGTASWNYTIADKNNETVATGVLDATTSVSAPSTPGIYTVTLADKDGYTVVKQVEVAGVNLVTALMEMSATTAVTGDNIGFAGSSNNATNYSWNFGDGTTSNEPTAWHAYTMEGVYTVVLTASNANGCASTTTNTITVTGKTVTGIYDVDDKTKIWTNKGMLYIKAADANVTSEVSIYNMLGQMLNTQKTGKGTYEYQLPGNASNYVIVQVKFGEKLTTQKVFIAVD